MAPLLISGIASVASSALDAWSHVAQQRVAVEKAKFDDAFSKAMGVAPQMPTAQGATAAQGLENQLRNAPEIRSILAAQDPSKPTSLQVSAEGRVWMQTAGNAPTELTVSIETRELARQLNSALNAAAPARTFSSAQVNAGSQTTLRG